MEDPNVFVLLLVLFVLIGMGLFFYYSNPERLLPNPPVQNNVISKTFAITIPKEPTLVPASDESFQLGELQVLKQSNNLSISKAESLVVTNNSTTLDVHAKILFHFSSILSTDISELFVYKWDIPEINVVFNRIGYFNQNVNFVNVTGTETIIKIAPGESLPIRPIVSDRLTTTDIQIVGAYVMIQEI